MKVNESNYEILKRVSEITLGHYEIKWFNVENIDGYIDEENIISMLEDLIVEVGMEQQKYEDYKRYIENEDEYDPNVEVPKIHEEGISW